MDVASGFEADAADDDGFGVGVGVLGVGVGVIIRLANCETEHGRSRRGNGYPFRGIFDPVGVWEGVEHPARDGGVVCCDGERCGVVLGERADEDVFGEA